MHIAYKYTYNIYHLGVHMRYLENIVAHPEISKINKNHYKLLFI